VAAPARIGGSPPAAVDETPEMGATARETGTVRSLHSIQVLLAGTDPRFLRAATFLLEREGFAVVGACRPDDAPSLARSERPHAVVVDGNESSAGAGRTALAIEATGLPVHVLVVASGSGTRGGPLTRIAECGSFAELTRELRRLYGS
jgi:DNA-binding NarL/FixJ family response regulator